MIVETRELGDDTTGRVKRSCKYGSRWHVMCTKAVLSFGHSRRLSRERGDTGDRPPKNQRVDIVCTCGRYIYIYVEERKGRESSFE